MKMPPSKIKKELEAFISIVNFLGKLSPSTASVLEPLRKLTSSKTLLTWNALYHTLYEKAKALIKDDVCMKFYDETKPLYLETDASGIGLVPLCYELDVEQHTQGHSTRQHHFEANCICKQQPDHYRMKIQ